MKVLIVEDDAVSRKMIEMLIKPFTENCDLAKDGQIALDFFTQAIGAESFYDLVLLDIMLPKMDVQTLLRKFRNLEEGINLYGSKGCRIIMVSALSAAGNVMEAFKNQCDGYLTKPYNKNNLISELEKLELLT